MPGPPFFLRTYLVHDEPKSSLLTLHVTVNDVLVMVMQPWHTIKALICLPSDRIACLHPNLVGMMLRTIYMHCTMLISDSFIPPHWTAVPERAGLDLFRFSDWS
jgi:hypothetical protein